MNDNWRAMIVLTMLMAAMPARAQVVTLEDVPIPPIGYFNSASFVSNGATFNNSYDPTFGSWGGFAASNVIDVTTPGFGNQYAAYAPPGGGDNSAQYAVGYVDPFTPTTPTITLPANTRPTSVRITNNTYAYFSMHDGDAFAKKFGGASGNDPDYFLLNITGYNAANSAVGSVDFYLADYRFVNNAQDYIVSGWTTVDLSSLANASSLQFTLTSTDNGPFGMNTPAYFALDNLSVTAVPEPSSMALFGVVALIGLWKRRKRGPSPEKRLV